VTRAVSRLGLPGHRQDHRKRRPRAGLALHADAPAIPLTRSLVIASPSRFFFHLSLGVGRAKNSSNKCDCESRDADARVNHLEVCIATARRSVTDTVPPVGVYLTALDTRLFKSDPYPRSSPKPRWAIRLFTLHSS